MIRSEVDVLRRDRLLVVEGKPALSAFLRERYPDCDVGTASTLLEGIYDLTCRPARAVLVYVDPAEPKLAGAVAGLREAAGDRTKLLLCCTPEAEPQVRKVVTSGADDYLLYPVEGAELDRALGFVRPSEWADLAVQPPQASMEELALLAQLLAALDQEGYAVLSKLADLIRLAMGSECVTVVVDGSAVTSGGTVVRPVLAEPIVREGRGIGQIMVGGRARAYTAGDVDKLRHYATLASHLLTAAGHHRQWRSAAMTDEVSGLYNRRYLVQELENLLERARQDRFRVTVLIFDIDNFKQYNDTYGHAAGDEIIRFIGQLFQSHCREHDLVARYGGDEFGVVFWDADQPRVAGSVHPADALSVLGRFQAALATGSTAAPIPAVRGTLTISGGLASFPWDAATASELIDKADQALIQAKRAGKNRVLVFGQPLENPAAG